MQTNNPNARRGRAGKWFVLVLGLLTLAGGAYVYKGSAFFTRKDAGEAPAALESEKITRLRVDEAALGLISDLLAQTPHDRRSLQSIREAFYHVGYRGVEKLRSQPAVGAEAEFDRLMKIAALYGYEGDFRQAGTVLQEAQALTEREPAQFARHRLAVIYLRGVMALRRGEVENCVECACRGSCIFPLQPQAFHQKPEGSEEAIQHFTNYLEKQPNDIGVRWLLNVAYMTLGRYPQGVPEKHLLPLAPFHSSLDIGRFVDLAPRLGLDRLHCSGGSIMDDFNNDGLLDIVETSSDPAVPMAFYVNQGDGTFANRAKEAGLEGQLGGLQCMQTDYNNDGWLDILVCRGGWIGPQRLSLLRNNKDGTFTDVTEAAGLLEPIDSQVAVWADYDNDGWLDLFVGGETTPSRLYHNNHDGTFTECAAKAGIINERCICKGANWGDWDGDGYPDLFVSNLDDPPRLFHNNRNGTFTEQSALVGVNHRGAGFACWFWDYDNDGWLDLFATGYERSLDKVIKSHLGLPHHGHICHLYRNVEGQHFEDVSNAVGLDLAMAPMGCNFGDFDGDGYLDFYLATGTPFYSMLVPNRMFKNVQGKRFADITLSSGTGHLQKGHGVAIGDWDGDGRVDMFVQMGGAVPGDRARSLLFQNPTAKHHWLTVRLVGTKTNRAAIGARLKVTLPSGQTIYRHITSGSSFGANSLQQTIGIGQADAITSLEVLWPTSGTTQLFTNITVDQAIEVIEFAKAYRRLHGKALPVPSL
jgi:hypothetical protein